MSNNNTTAAATAPTADSTVVASSSSSSTTSSSTTTPSDCCASSSSLATYVDLDKQSSPPTSEAVAGVTDAMASATVAVAASDELPPLAHDDDAADADDQNSLIMQRLHSDAGGGHSPLCSAMHLSDEQRQKRTHDMEELSLTLTHTHRPLVLCGASGAGKGTLLARVYSRFPGRFSTCVSHTTRAPRQGEVNGEHYHFVDKPKMEQEISDGKFIEHAHVHSNIYGTSVQSVADVGAAGKICVLEIDVQGAELVRTRHGERLRPHYVFIHVPSFEVLRQRLTARGTETSEQLEERLRNARKEEAFAMECGFFTHTLVNDDLDVAYGRLRDILLSLYPYIADDEVDEHGRKLSTTTTTTTTTTTAAAAVATTDAGKTVVDAAVGTDDDAVKVAADDSAKK